jgi:RNA polymerase sigma factor (sigma-70 family)
MSHDIRHLIQRAQAGDMAARNAVVMATYGFVSKLAYRVARRSGRPDLVEELIQVGIVGDEGGNGGLLRAITHFDLGRGLAFTTFAAPRIEGAMVEAVNRTHHAGSRDTAKRTAQILRAARRWERDHERPPTAAELQAEFRRPYSLAYLEGVLSRRAYAHEDLADEHADPDVTETALVGALDARHAAEIVERGMVSLSDRERAVVCSFFGIGCAPRSQAQIADDLGVQERQVRRLLRRALSELRDELDLGAEASEAQVAQAA